MDCNFTIRN